MVTILPQAVFIAVSSRVKASQQEGHFQLASRLLLVIFLYPAAEANDVVSSVVSYIILMGARATAIAHADLKDRAVFSTFLYLLI